MPPRRNDPDAGVAGKSNGIKRVDKEAKWARPGSRLNRVDPRRRATHLKCETCAEAYKQ
jgi:hypothetical protein